MVNPTDKLTLDGQVTSDDVALQLEWNYQALTTGEVPFPLDSTTLMTGTDQESLVVRPDVLTAGASYRFSLHATNSVGTATTSLDVIVNRAPQGGGVDVTPSQGVALSTTFVILTHDWEDDDGQLWHQILYRLEGQGDESWSPITSDYNMLLDPYTMSAVIPLAGVEEFEHAVTVRVAVQDALGATATAETRITVTPAEDLDTGAVLATAEGDLRNGNVDSSMQLISGLSGALNEEAPRRVKRRRRTLLQSSAEAPARQRESMLDMVTEVEGILFATTATIATLVSAVGQIVEAPCELYPSVQTKALSLAQRLVAPITSTGNAIWITTETATAVARSLSMINQAGQVLFCPNGTAAGTGNLSAAGSANRTEDCRQSMTLLAEALLAGTVAGEDQKRVGSTTLTLVAQRCRSDLPESCLYTTAFASPGDLAASASFPASLGLALAAATAKPPPQELTATPTGAFTGANGTANGGALPPMTVAVTLIALGSDPHHTADGDSAGRPASSIAALAFTDEAGLELHVDDMEDAAELAVELAEAYSGTVADVEMVDEEVLEAGQKAWAASAPLIVLLIVVGASTVLAAGSACAHLEEQHRVIRQLAQQGGSGMHGFRELAGAAYTWTVFGEERHYGAVRHSEQHDVIAEALGVAQAAVSCRVPAEDQGLDAISAEISMRWDEPGTAIDAAADVETDDAADEQRRRQRQLGHVEAGTDGRVGMQDNGRGAEVMQTTRLQHEGEHSEMFDIAEDSGSEEHELEAVQRLEQQLQVRVDAEDGEAPMLSAVGLSLEPLPSPGPAVSDMSPLNLPRKPNATAFAELASEAGLAPADLGAPFAASRLGEEGDHHTVAEAQGIAFVQEEGDSDPQAEASSSSLIHAGRLRGELSNSHSLQEDDEAHILDDGDDGDEHDLESTWGLATMPPRPQHGAGRPPKPHVGAGLDTEAESSDSWAMSVPNRAAPSRGHPPAPSAAPSSQESAGTGLRGARVGSAKEGGRRLLSAKAKARAETLLGGAGRELRPSTATALPRRPPSAASPSLASTLLGDAPGKEGAPTTSAASGSGDSLQLEAPTPEMSLPQLSAGDVALGGREYTEVDLGIVDDDSGEEGDLSQWNRPTTVPDLKLPASRPGSAARSRPSSAARSRPSSAARSRPSSAARGGPGSASATPRLDKMAVQNVGPEAAENVEEWRTPALQSMMERLEAEKGAKKSGLLSNLPKPKLPSLSKVSSVLQGAGPVGSEGTSPLASARGLVKSLSQAATFRGTKDKYRVAHDASLSSASTSFPSTTDPSSASGAGPVAEANSTESAENVLTLREQHAQFHASSRAEGEVKSEGTESSSRTTGVSSSAAAPQAEVPVTSSARPGLEATGSSTGRMASGGVAGASPEAGQGEKKAGKGLQRWREEAAKEEAISSEVNASQKRAKKAKERKEGQRTPAKVKSSEGSEEAGPSSAASAQVPKKPKRVASKTEKSHKEKKQKKAKRKARQRGKPVATSSAGETTDYSETEAEGEPEDPTPQAVVPELQRPTLPDAPPRPAGDGSAAPPTASEPTPAALLANTDIEDAPQGELAGAPSGVHGPHEDDSAVSGGGTSAAGGNPGEEYAANVSATAGLSSAKLVQLESPRKMAVVSDSEKDELVPPVMPEDLRVTERLCELLGTSLTALQLSMPYASLHQAARRGQTPEAMQPLERLLGTSLVLAFLDVQRIASDPGVAAQWALVKKIRWETPAASAAPKYIDLCKVLVGAVGRQRPGWYSAALQLRLALLQLPDGSFDLSPGLAGVLHAGSPEQVLAADAVSQLSASAMMEAMPVQLRGYDAISEEARGRVWATLLAAESASTLPTSWVWNPEAPAPQRRTLEAHAVGFLRQQCQDHGELQSMHSVLQSQ
eukprot:gene6483-7771_t